MGAELSLEPVRSLGEARPGEPLLVPSWVSMPPAIYGGGPVAPFFGGAYVSRELFPRGAPSGLGPGGLDGAPLERIGLAEPMGTQEE
mmetsp:Transcript_131821/g.409807  ORF Transcript_131821/g.409807 Transcript_131821/m.409807 type:complete len:87 (-) Transcript_131821:26-286(-)